jgi:hypothetical protein
MICVMSFDRDADGRVIGRRWCATRKKTTRYQDHVRTLCDMVVTLPCGIDKRHPDCPECLAKLEE